MHGSQKESRLQRRRLTVFPASLAWRFVWVDRRIFDTQHDSVCPLVIVAILIIVGWEVDVVLNQVSPGIAEDFHRRVARCPEHGKGERHQTGG